MRQIKTLIVWPVWISLFWVGWLFLYMANLETVKKNRKEKQKTMRHYAYLAQMEAKKYE